MKYNYYVLDNVNENWTCINFIKGEFIAELLEQRPVSASVNAEKTRNTSKKVLKNSLGIVNLNVNHFEIKYLCYQIDYRSERAAFRPLCSENTADRIEFSKYQCDPTVSVHDR